MTFRYDPQDNSYHHDMEGSGVVCSAVDILPTEFAREVKVTHLLSFNSLSFAKLCSGCHERYANCVCVPHSNNIFGYKIGFPTLW